VRPESRVIDAKQDLLDLQILDRDGRPVGRVDDVELDDSGGGPPVVVALLCGAPALAYRFRGWLGAVIRGIYVRLHDDRDPSPLRIPIEHVRHINSRVDLQISADELGIGRFDRWIVDNLLGRIPGADYAPE
jgi:sporulation protein YlmC with PRC-barrel domain